MGRSAYKLDVGKRAGKALFFGANSTHQKAVWILEGFLERKLKTPIVIKGNGFLTEQ